MLLRTLMLALALSFITISPSSAHAETALQMHVAFFDRDSDGMITWSDTYEGCRALGFGVAKSAALASAINLALGSSTGGGTFTVSLENIHLGKHDSDTDVYDENGNYSHKMFERLFNTYDTDGDDALSEDEFSALYSRKYESAAGSVGSRAEFGLLLDIAGVDRSKTSTWSACSYWWCPSYTRTVSYKALTKDTMSEFYDGSLFYTIAGESFPF